MGTLSYKPTSASSWTRLADRGLCARRAGQRRTLRARPTKRTWDCPLTEGHTTAIIVVAHGFDDCGLRVSPVVISKMPRTSYLLSIHRNLWWMRDFGGAYLILHNDQESGHQLIGDDRLLRTLTEPLRQLLPVTAREVRAVLPWDRGRPKLLLNVLRELVLLTV